MLAENYPRGHKELKGAFFNTHGPVDTMTWFSDHGVELKVVYFTTSCFHLKCICCANHNVISTDDRLRMMEGCFLSATVRLRLSIVSCLNQRGWEV